MPRPFIPRSRRLPVLAVALAVAGCAGGPSTYPSLAPRPIERLSLTEPSRPAAPAAVADPAAVARFAPLVDKARTLDAAFRATLDEERPALERGRAAAAGSDAWAAAQTALTRVQSARGGLAQVLADLDAARNAPGAETDTGTAIAAAQAFDAVERIDEEEAAAMRAAWPAGS